MQINDGGPAYPVPTADQSCGMSLRDHFAGLAMQGLIATENPWRSYGYKPVNGLSIPENDARLAYQIADAMIRARGQGEQHG